MGEGPAEHGPKPSASHPGASTAAEPSPRSVPLLRQRSFAALWWGQLISILGERLTYLALVGLLAEHTDHFRTANSSLLLSILANVMLAPVLAFAPFTGAWVDRSNLKRVMVVSDVLRGGLVVLIPVLYGATHHTAPVFALLFVLFTCNVFFLPAKSAITPEIVPAGQLFSANALLAAAGIAATAAGALLGGWFVDHFGWPRAMLVNGATYLASVVALLAIRYRPTRSATVAPRITVRGYVAEVMEGWTAVRDSPAVKLGLTALAAVWVGGGFLHVAGNQHIQRAASAPGMERLGVLLCVLALGSGVGTWWTNARAHLLPRPLLLGGGLVLAAGGLTVFAFSTVFAVFAAAAFVIGLAAAPAFTLSETLLQQGTEPRRRGRVFSLRDFLMRLVFLIGVIVAGGISRAFGLRAALLAAALIVAAAGVLAMSFRRGDAALVAPAPPASPDA